MSLQKSLIGDHGDLGVSVMLPVDLGRKREGGNASENVTTRIMEIVMDMTMKQ